MMHTTRVRDASAEAGRRPLLGTFWRSLALTVGLCLTVAVVGLAQEKPAAKVEKPAAKVEKPVVKAEKPVATVERPVPKVERPVAKADKKEVPPPVELGGDDLLTRDGMILKATFYPGTKGKDTVPVILLHSSEGDRKEFATLAPFLQSRGHAVLAPDLRGHGESKQVVIAGRVRELGVSRLRPADYQAMVTQDMEALKAFLVRQNDEGQLNVNKLCVIGAEMGASVALHWAKLDWSWPVLAGLKQGQDVKALVLISPKWSFPGLPLHEALAHPVLRTQMSMLILFGRGDSSFLGDARRLHRLVQRRESELPVEKKTLFFGELNTKLQGAKLLDVKGLNLEQLIAQFIELRLVNQDYPWIERKR